MYSNAPKILNYDQLYEQLPLLNRQFVNNDPFPHIIIDDFIREDVCLNAADEFPGINDKAWFHYDHYNEDKRGLSDLELMPTIISQIIQELNSDKFLSFLSKLTGINGLLADSQLEGGGIHQSGKGGFLNIHADFTSHPHQKNWRRKLNLFLYLNKTWEKEWGGEIELWDKQINNSIVKAAPIFNRCLIFLTDVDSFHGHPSPMVCPKNVTRNSIALYYFTEESNPIVKGTNYKPRPSDYSRKKLMIFIDKLAVNSYYFMKTKLKLGDRFGSNLLQLISKFRHKN